jgi:hypothetical protein
MNKPLLFLDFDGVICDSAPECFVSSRFAYRELAGLPAEVPESVLNVPEKDRFYHFRPFIRNGEDYVVIQKIIAERLPVVTQEDFDREIARVGASQMEEYAAAFRRVRERFLVQNRSFWFGLNRLFSPLDDALRNVSSIEAVYILSTKRPEFIIEIFGNEGISWNPERILFSGKKSKSEVIGEVLVKTGSASGILIDDQFDHLQTASRDKRIRPVLARWGFIKAEWLDDASIESMTIEEATTLVSTYHEV